MNGAWLALGGAAVVGVLKNARGSLNNEWNRDGFPWPPEQPLFHGTASWGLIGSQGFRTRKGGAHKAGGGRHDKSVSLTLSPKRAASFALAFDVLRKGAREEITLVQLLDRLRQEIPHAFPEAITSGYNLQGITIGRPAPFNRLRGYFRKIDAGWKCVSSFEEPPTLTGVQWVSGNIYLVPPKMDMGDAFYPRNTGSKKDAWARGRLVHLSREEIFLDTYRSGLTWGSNAQECFNPYLIGTDMKALKRRKATDVGMVVATSSVPRICTDGRGAVDLGYLPYRESQLDPWHHDCEVGLEREGDDRYAQYRLQRRMDLPVTMQNLPHPPWSVRDEGARDASSAMLYVPNEQEVRIFCTDCIHVEEFVEMPRIRREFEIGDRLTFPWFNPAEENTAVWPPT